MSLSSRFRDGFEYKLDRSGGGREYRPAPPPCISPRGVDAGVPHGRRFDWRVGATTAAAAAAAMSSTALRGPSRIADCCYWGQGGGNSGASGGQRVPSSIIMHARHHHHASSSSSSGEPVVAHGSRGVALHAAGRSLPSPAAGRHPPLPLPYGVDLGAYPLLEGRNVLVTGARVGGAASGGVTAGSSQHPIGAWRQLDGPIQPDSPRARPHLCMAVRGGRPHLCDSERGATTPV